MNAMNGNPEAALVDALEKSAAAAERQTEQINRLSKAVTALALVLAFLALNQVLLALLAR